MRPALLLAAVLLVAAAATSLPAPKAEAPSPGGTAASYSLPERQGHRVPGVELMSNVGASLQG